jgi:hypothetical protein
MGVELGDLKKLFHEMEVGVGSPSQTFLFFGAYLETHVNPPLSREIIHPQRVCVEKFL